MDGGRLRGMVVALERSKGIVMALVMVGLVVGSLAGGGGAGAAGPQKDGEIRQGTPISASALPDPAECIVAPRTADELRALAPGGHRRRYRPRTAVVVDPALIDDVTAAIRVYVACLNSGDDYRLYGMLTDDYVRNIPSGDGFLVDNDVELDFKATPIAIRWGYLYPMPRLLAVTALDDGRVATDIVFSRPEGETRKTLVWIALGGRWLVDEERDSVDQELTPRDIEDFQA